STHRCHRSCRSSRRTLSSENCEYLSCRCNPCHPRQHNIDLQSGLDIITVAYMQAAAMLYGDILCDCQPKANAAVVTVAGTFKTVERFEDILEFALVDPGTTILD